MTHPLRTRILRLGAPDIEVADDGREFVFRSAPAGGPAVVLRWRVDDPELTRLAADLEAGAREAWGTPRADGMYVILGWIEELVRTSPGGQGRIVVHGSSLALQSDPARPGSGNP